MSEDREGYIRISAVSSAFAGYGQIPKSILDKAACRGSKVHSLIFNHLSDIPNTEEDFLFGEESLEGYFASFQKMWKQYEGWAIGMQETEIVDEERKLTGTPDLLLRHKGKSILFDWKATSAAGVHWQIQAEGYCYLLKMVEKINLDEIFFVRLQKDGSDAEIISYRPYVNTFLNALEFYKKFMYKQKVNLESE